MTQALQASASRDTVAEAKSTASSIGRERLSSLVDATHRYLDLMCDCDVSRFDQVFAPSVQLHGYRDGQMKVWPAETDRRHGGFGLSDLALHRRDMADHVERVSRRIERRYLTSIAPLLPAVRFAHGETTP